jgi:hypothetical protein
MSTRKQGKNMEKRYTIKGGYASEYGDEIPVECTPEELDTVGYAICYGYDWDWCVAYEGAKKVKTYRDCM